MCLSIMHDVHTERRSISLSRPAANTNSNDQTGLGFLVCIVARSEWPTPITDQGKTGHSCGSEY